MKIFTQSVIQFTKTKPLLLVYIKNSTRNAQEKYVLSPRRQTLTNTVWANVNIKYTKFLQYLNWREKQWQNMWKSVTWCLNVYFIFDWHIKIEFPWWSQIKRSRTCHISNTHCVRYLLMKMEKLSFQKNTQTMTMKMNAFTYMNMSLRLKCKK